MENILYFSNKNNYKNLWCKTEDEIVSWGEGEDLVAIKSDYGVSYFVATYDVRSVTSNTQLLGTSFDKSQIIEMYIDDVKIDNVVTSYTFNTIGEHTVKMCTKCMTSYSYMFNNCSGLTLLDLSNFKPSNVSNMTYMFSGCSKLNVIYYNGNDNEIYNELFNYNKTYCPSCCNKIDIVNPITIRCNYWDKLYTEGKTYNMVLDNGCRAEYDAENDQYVFTFIAEKGKFKYDVYVDGVKEDYIKVTNELDVVLINTNSIIYEEVSITSTSASYRLIYSSYTQYIDAMFIDGEETTISSAKTISTTSCTKNVKIAFDTSNCTSMQSMFYGCDCLTSLELSNFDTSKVTNMSSMFSNCYRLTSITFGDNFNTSNVTNMSYMFYDCYDLTSLNVSNFDTSKVTDMGYMFHQCYDLTSLDLSSFNTSSVTNMYRMFYYCYKLTSLDLSSFNTSKVTSMGYMFWDCGDLTSITFSNSFNTSKVTNMSYMFSGCLSLISLDVTSFDTSNVTNMNSMFSACYKLTSITFSNKFDTSKVTNMEDMFNYSSGLTSLDLSSFDTSNVTNMNDMFNNCNKLTSITFGDNFNTSKVTYMTNMFSYCKSLTSLNLSSFNTSNVTSMGEMFYNCSNLKSITFGLYSDVSKVTSYSGMFRYLPSNGTLTYPCAYSDEWNRLLVTYSGSTYFPSSWTKQCEAIEVTNKIKFIEDGVELTSGNFTVNDVQCVYNSEEQVWEVTHAAEQKTYNVLRDDVEVGNVNISKKLNYVFIGNNNNSYFSITETVSASSTSSSYRLIYSSFIPYIDAMFIDGEQVDISSAKTFSSVGEHTVQMMIDTSNITSMPYMFSGCTSLTSIEFNDTFDTSKVTSMYYMFYNCSKLKLITFGNKANVSNVTSYSYIFSSLPSNGTLTYPCAYSNAWNKLINQLPSSWTKTCKSSEVTNKIKFIEDGVELTSGNFTVNDVQCVYNEIDKIWEVTHIAEQQVYSVLRDDVEIGSVDNKFKVNHVFIGNNNSSYSGFNVVETVSASSTSSSYRLIYSSFTQYIDAMLIDGQQTTISSAKTFSSKGEHTVQMMIDTSNLTSMYNMFYYCQNLTSLDLSNFDTSNVTSMYYMFYGCNYLKSIIFGNNFDTSNVTNMDYMFSGCTSLTSLELSNFDTSNVTTMNGMFSYCYNLTSLDLSSFDTSKVISMSYMFQICSGLTSLNVSSFDTSVVTSMNGMFYNCRSLTSLNVSSFDTSKVTTMEYMFNSCSGLTSLDLSSFDTSNVSYMSYMFQNCGGLILLDLSSFDTSKVSNMSYMFQYCSGLTSLNVSSFDTSAVTSMNGMFQNCSDLTSLNVSNFDTSKVTDMSYIFQNCSGLTSLDVSNFNTSKVTSMSSMFGSCKNLTSLNVSNFNTSNVTNMQYIFSNCSKLTSLDLSSFDTFNVTNIEYMFNCCSSLTSLTMTSDIPKLNYTNNMFSGITTNGIFTYPCMYDYEIITNKLPTSWTENCVSIANVTLNFVIIDNNIEVTEGTVIVNDIEATYSNENGYWSVTYTIDEPYSNVILNGTNIGIITNSKYNNLQHILIGDCSNYVDISATYTATSANQTISLFSGSTTTSAFNLSNIESIYVDGKMITPRSSYTFTTVGEHDVKYFVKDSITTMSFYYAFYNIDYLKTIKFGDRFNNENSVSTLEYAFHSCDRLQFADLSNISMSANTSNEQLYYCFSYCPALTSVYLPQNIDDIGDYCFYNCSGLTSINIPNSVKYIGYSAFTNCYRLSEIRIPSSVTSIDTSCFGNCSGATSLVFEEGCQLKTIPSSGFMNCDSLTTVTIPEGITTINTSSFYSCNNIKTITLPSTLTSIGNSGFSYCNSALTEIYSYAKTAPSIGSYTFNNVKSNGTLHIPTNADYSSWLSTSNYYLGCYSWNSTILYTATTCTSLNITALDVKGRATSTTISYTAVTNGVDSEGNEVMNVTITGTAESTPFEQNTDTANTVTRTITFEYMGVTASTEITQGVWTNETYSINLNNQWQLSTTISNPDSSVYDGVYESYAHKGVNSSADICIITIEGYTNFTLYVRSYAESTWDYVVVSNLDCTLNSETTGGTSVKMTTSGKQNSGTAIGNYTKVEFTNIDGGLHTIQVMYRKDSSASSGDDRGYLLIPKEQ